MAVLVLVVVFLVDLVKQTIVRDGLEKDVDQVAYNRDDSNSTGDQASVVCDVDVGFVVWVLVKVSVENGGQYESRCKRLVWLDNSEQ